MSGLGNLTNCVVQLFDAGDGSGDAILPLSEKILDELGWDEGDDLLISCDEESGRIIISREE